MLLGGLFLLSACGGNSNSSPTQTTGGTETEITQPSSHQMGGSIQTELPSLTGSVTTFAGVLPGSEDGTGTAARFTFPTGVTSDGTNVYVADSGSNTIRKVNIATGMVTTIAGKAGTTGFADGIGVAARFVNPDGIATDGSNLYVADSGNNTIRKIVIATGDVTTLAGTPQASGSTDGSLTAARFMMPRGIATDGTNLYVTDTGNHTIRRITLATGEVTTLAGTAGTAGSTDGIGTAAHFNAPRGIATDGVKLYIADSGNSTVRQIVIATRAVTTLAGTAGVIGHTDGTGSAALFHYPVNVTTDLVNVYVTDVNSFEIRKIAIATGDVTTVAVSLTAGDADGTFSTGTFYSPWGITWEGGNLYTCDSWNRTVRKVAIATGAATRLAGFSPTGYNDGSRASARFNSPSGITTDGSSLYVTDLINSTVRKIAIATDEVTTLAGTAGTYGSANGTGVSATFKYPSGIATDGTNLYVSDSYSAIRKVHLATGSVTTLAGGNIGSADGVGTEAGFNGPIGVTTDGTHVFVADYGNHTIRKIVIATGVVTTLAGSAGIPGSADGTGAAALFKNPTGVATDGTSVYVTDWGNGTIRKIEIATGKVATFAGTPGILGHIDGTGTAALFQKPYGITSDGTSLYVADPASSTIRKIVISTGVVTTLAGAAGRSGYTDGTETAALFDGPTGITTDGVSLYVTDSYNNTIRKIR